MDKRAKNALASVGAVSLVAAAPVLVAGVAIGAALANPEKAKNTAKDLVGRAKIGLAKYGILNIEEDECECCCGGMCDCEEECCCDLSSEEDAQPSENEEASFDDEPEVNVAPAVEFVDETVDSEEEGLNPSEEGKWGAT